jgi:hypothetical protein
MRGRVHVSLTIITKTPRFATGFAAIGPNGRPHPVAYGTLAKRLGYRSAMRKPIEHTGFTPPSTRALGREHRRAALAELVAIVGLALSTIVAATVVSVGIARADVVTNVIDNEGSMFTVALVLGVIFIAMGGLSVISQPRHKAKKQ